MTGQQFVETILAIITICSIGVTAYVIPFLKSKISEADIDKLSYFATVAVRCAEQIYKPEEWQRKKVYVMEYMQDIIKSNLHIDITTEQLDTIIEGIVNEVKHGDNK